MIIGTCHLIDAASSEKVPVSPIIKLDCSWTIGLINEVNFMTFIKVFIFHDWESSEKWDCCQF